MRTLSGRRLAAGPMRRCGRVAYPTKLEVAARPELLRQHMPPAWLSRAELATAAGVLLTLDLAGCSPAPTNAPPNYPTSIPAKAPANFPPRNEAVPPRRAIEPDVPAIVAPIFNHGEGRAAMGCDVVNPPFFLPEDEALSIIQEELIARGLDLRESKVPLEGVMIQKRELRRAFDWVAGEEDYVVTESATVSLPLLPKLRNEWRHVAIVHVSEETYCDLGGLNPGAFPALYNFEDVAHYVRQKVAEQGKDVYLGVFYEPAVTWDFRGDGHIDYEHADENAAIEAKRLLREQVKDFADWLKGQGVI